MSKDIWTTVRNIALTVTVLSAIFFVLNIGIGQTYDVLTDPAQVEADALLNVAGNTNQTYIDADATVQAFGGEIDFIERMGTLGMVVIAIGPLGLGAIKARSGTKTVDETVKYALPIVALIAAVTMGDTIMELLQGDRVWANFTDAQNSWVLGNAGAVVAGITGWLKSRNE